MNECCIFLILVSLISLASESRVGCRIRILVAWYPSQFFLRATKHCTELYRFYRSGFVTTPGPVSTSHEISNIDQTKSCGIARQKGLAGPKPLIPNSLISQMSSFSDFGTRSSKISQQSDGMSWLEVNHFTTIEGMSWLELNHKLQTSYRFVQPSAGKLPRSQELLVYGFWFYLISFASDIFLNIHHVQRIPS